MQMDYDTTVWSSAFKPWNPSSCLSLREGRLPIPEKPYFLLERHVKLKKSEYLNLLQAPCDIFLIGTVSD